VKLLAAQTAKATEDIAAQIGKMQSASANAARAITTVNEIIMKMSEIATNVSATVQEQNAAVSSIAEGMQLASADAQSGVDAIKRVSEVSAGARTTARDVKAFAGTLTAAGERLDAEVRQFLGGVRSA
jgi:methyl-accepting chemotaxis protein